MNQTSARAAADRRRSHVSSLQTTTNIIINNNNNPPTTSPSAAAVFPPSPTVSGGPSGPGRSHGEAQWLSPDKAATATVGCSRVMAPPPAPEVVYAHSLEVSMDVGDVSNDVSLLSDLNVQLETLNR